MTLLSIIILVFLDQLTKYLFFNRHFLDNLYIFHFHVKNFWISRWLRILPEYLLTILIWLVLIFVTYLYQKKQIDKIALILILSGWIWNLIDRIFLWYVRDFITIPFIHFPTFNLADILITFWFIWIVRKWLEK